PFLQACEIAGALTPVIEWRCWWGGVLAALRLVLSYAGDVISRATARRDSGRFKALGCHPGRAPSGARAGIHVFLQCPIGRTGVHGFRIGSRCASRPELSGMTSPAER